MRALLERHGVLIVWTDEADGVPDTLAGLSLLAPIPTVLVNLRYGRESAWHTRMTLAHELGHLLFDHLRRGVDVVRSPARGEGLDDLERHADAFAACFLAPAAEVRACIGHHAPDSVAAVVAVGKTFGVGCTVAINRLQDVFRLSNEARADLQRRVEGLTFEGRVRADVPDDEEIGLRRGTYRARVLEAYRQSKLPRSRVWPLLGLMPNEALDAPGLSDEARRPLRSRAMQMVDRARELLASRAYGDSVAAAWTPAGATHRDDGRWTVTLVRGTGAPDDAPATLTLDDDGALLDVDAPGHDALTNLLRTRATRA